MPEKKKIYQTLLNSLFFIFFTFLNVHSVHSLNNPPILKYDAEEYAAGNQNWMIHQLPNNDIVVGNEYGLLIYNGGQWKLYKTPNHSFIRSVCVFGDKIYTGSFRDFGYWERNVNGQYYYTSISEELGLSLKKDEQFWNVLINDNQVLFQSLNQIYEYKPILNEVKVIKAPYGVNKLFKLGTNLYFQNFNWDIYQILNSKPVLYYPGNKLPHSEIIKMFSTDHGIKFITKEHGFYYRDNDVFKKWDIPGSEYLEPGDFFSAIQLKNGDFALGTITRGVIILDKEGAFKLQLDQLIGINNNTVLSLFEDRDNNLWLGLDNGISVVNLKSPISEYIDIKGRIGTVYTSIVFNDQLYVGTNQGLFYKKRNTQEDFQLVQNSNGQVWSLFEFDNTLFCCHNLGTFTVEKGIATKIADVLGTWQIKSVEGRRDKLIQGNYEGLHVLEKKNGNWQYGHPLNGFDFSIRLFVIEGNNIVIYHTSEGLIHCKMDENISSISGIKLVKEARQKTDASLVLSNGQVYFNDNDGLFKLTADYTELSVVQVPAECENYDGHTIPQMVYSDPTSFWVIYNDGIILIDCGNKDSLRILKKLPIDPALLKTKENFENISEIGPEIYLLGLTNGYLQADFSTVDQQKNDFRVYINSIILNQKGYPDSLLNLDQAGSFKHTQNNISFYFNVANLKKYRAVLYQYKLEGDHNEWSNWTSDSNISFYRLKPGNHTFKVRAKISNELTENIASYTFKISNPWFLSGFGLLVYGFILILLIIMINFLYISYYKKKQKKILEENKKELEYIKLKSDQELIKIKNIQLSSEIESKNKELAVTAMSLVKKNEILIEIREALQKVEFNKVSTNQVLRSINSEIENEESWEMLKNAFENVDKDFIQTVLKQHKNLTPSDLKLCIYLRLNLNSKEIASLLNISVRSMETKRYRLRKKMELSHDTNLVEYILSI
jgi:AraC family chitin signaling transcriptional activator